jgi:hypothetical protein
VPTRPRVLASLSAYACEGGLDGRHQPSTCYSPTIALGRHRGPGPADGLWADYEVVLALAHDLGVTGVCLEVSWARLEPRRGRRDESALERYREVISAARRRGLFVGVAAIDAAWPAWLGQEAWLMPWVAPVAVEYARWLAGALAADSMSVFAARGAMTRGFVEASAGPPWRRGAHADAADAERNLDAIEARVRAGSPAPWVSSTVLDLDDVSVAPTLDVDEVHVRSLVRGSGPLASAGGLLARRGDRWVAVRDDLPPELTH